MTSDVAMTSSFSLKTNTDPFSLPYSPVFVIGNTVVYAVLPIDHTTTRPEQMKRCEFYQSVLSSAEPAVVEIFMQQGFLPPPVLFFLLPLLKQCRWNQLSTFWPIHQQRPFPLSHSLCPRQKKVPRLVPLSKPRAFRFKALQFKDWNWLRWTRSHNHLVLCSCPHAPLLFQSLSVLTSSYRGNHLLGCHVRQCRHVLFLPYPLVCLVHNCEIWSFA